MSFFKQRDVIKNIRNMNVNKIQRFIEEFHSVFPDESKIGERHGDRVAWAC